MECVFSTFHARNFAFRTHESFFLVGGKSLVNAYFNAIKNLWVEIFYEFEALDLMVENGCCKEILVLDKKQNQEVKIKTKAVIVASWGFESNLEWLEEACG